MESVKAVLESKAGEALLSSAIGYGLTYASGDLIEDSRIQNIAEEFRINGFHRVEEAVFDVVLNAVSPSLMQSLVNSFEELPVAEKVEDYEEVEYEEVEYEEVDFNPPLVFQEKQVIK
jgi:hypothetical protein